MCAGAAGRKTNNLIYMGVIICLVKGWRDNFDQLFYKALLLKNSFFVPLLARSHDSDTPHRNHTLLTTPGAFHGALEV